MSNIKPYKKYKSTTGVEYNFYVRVDGKERFVSLGNPGATLITHDMELAKAIENSNPFKKGKISLERTFGEIEKEKDNESDNGDEDTETKSYPEVKNMGDAVDVLMNEYGVDEADIPLKKDVLAKAKELGITFPKYR